MTFRWPQPVDWPTPAFLEELRAKAYAETLRIMAHPDPAELDINEQTLDGHKLEDLVIEFSGLSIHLNAGRRGYYYLVRHDIAPPGGSAGKLPLFVYKVEFSPEGEFLDEYFYPVGTDLKLP